MLELFLQFVVLSAAYLTVVCWRSSIGVSDTNRLHKLITKAGSVIGCKLDTILAVVEKRSLHKLCDGSWVILTTFCITYWTTADHPI